MKRKGLSWEAKWGLAMVAIILASALGLVATHAWFDREIQRATEVKP